MLRAATRFQLPARRAIQSSAKSFSVLASSNPLALHGRGCRCGNCSGHGPGCACVRCQSRAFSVQSQTKYDIPKTQKAVVFEKNGAPLQVHEDWPVVQPDELKPGEVLVRLAYSGVCHTDLHVWLGDWPVEINNPLVGGHEGAGYVAAIGKHTNTKLKVGDAVGVKWLANSCLDCEDCRKAHEPNCETAENHGFTVDGTFQQWCVSYAAHVTPIPEGLPLPEAAPVLCAGLTVYKALMSFDGHPGDFVVIPGAGGGLGHLACQYARAMGYRVIAIDSGEDKRKLVESYGVTDFIDYKQGGAVDKIKALTGGRGAHATIVVASGPGAYQDALDMLRPHGAVVMVGAPKDTNISANVFASVGLSHRIIGSYVGSRQDAVEALKLAARGDVKVNYEIENLSNLPSIFDRMAAGKVLGRVVVDCA